MAITIDCYNYEKRMGVVSTERIRGRGSNITGNGKSEGVVPWAKIYDSTIIATNQGSVRRGAASVNLVE